MLHQNPSAGWTNVIICCAQGEVVHWLACSLYAACRKSSVPTVGKGLMEGNCVSLTRILRSSKLRSVLITLSHKRRDLTLTTKNFTLSPSCFFSLIQFFSKIKKWADMSSLSQDFRLRIDRLERNFEVSTVIFRKFQPIFMDMFQNPQGAEPPRQPRSRKHRQDSLNPECYVFCGASSLSGFWDSYNIALFHKRWVAGNFIWVAIE